MSTPGDFSLSPFILGGAVDPRSMSQLGNICHADYMSTSTESQERSLNNPNDTHPEIVNVVSTFQLGVKLELRKIVQKARNAEYNPKRFAGAIMRISSPKSTALIFQTGKIVCTGTRSIEESKIASKKYAKIIKKIGYPIHYSNFNVQNIVGSCDVKFQIALRTLVDSYLAFCQYEPEVFPGLVYRMASPKVTLLVFSTGKVVLTGAKDEESLNLAYKNIYPILLANRKEDISNQ
ncbi:transcription initiation factor TFIID, putative [Entamoeba histolytica HM-3:IMSS]|uniref:TATA-box-binding protein 1 n=7 Tax=Entamoeba histolytica TaxID=5759 RepID=TBP1_ENTH1|nr:transcription initiation factor TFIID, putative [Entamoeba histolytica HM-1:IMSS]P52653.2 RecName: Full=TATA-box-binding protein 1; Short=EhTBP; AltName: Full=TATA sequence-binding protein; AltName: Full=TATA-binding factor; AltName: Full=TATA-box factor; AltName: Full=Transcription initiation factor TFIID TBP subunit [Entamoeba histolytica HM-1:IMSS]EMD43805.1 transcription initiation factor tfiid, putative [Entamoeba histolytica KU27]EMS16350.1 transcription initiation factor TFIID, putativ|eukprot:XP_001914239.1 transcription initiation factor TFIID, putative [Entamoeba histolytica HM-1:IMSS]